MRISAATLVFLFTTATSANSARPAKNADWPAHSVKNLSFDLSKTGKNEELIVKWKKSAVNETGSCGPLGTLRLIYEAGRIKDEFDLGAFVSVQARMLELPERNVLLVQTCGGGAAGGARYDAFALANGTLYRVQLINQGKMEALIFNEYGSAGAPFAIKFRDGRKISTLTTTINEPKVRHLITDYSWDGQNYRQEAQSECAREKCELND